MTNETADILDTILLEGDLVSDIALPNNTANLTAAELSDLLERAAYKGYLLAEEKRQYYLTTPDGLRDKTIHNYKPNPYQTILNQSSSLLLVEGTGTETWRGDPPSALSSELITDISSRLFSIFPAPILLSERLCMEERDEPGA